MTILCFFVSPPIPNIEKIQVYEVYKSREVSFFSSNFPSNATGIMSGDPFSTLVMTIFINVTILDKSVYINIYIYIYYIYPLFPFPGGVRPPDPPLGRADGGTGDSLCRRCFFSTFRVSTFSTLFLFQRFVRSTGLGRYLIFFS